MVGLDSVKSRVMLDAAGTHRVWALQLRVLFVASNMIRFMLPKQIPLKVYANAETRDRSLTDLNCYSNCMHTVNISIFRDFLVKEDMWYCKVNAGGSQALGLTVQGPLPDLFST